LILVSMPFFSLEKVEREREEANMVHRQRRQLPRSLPHARHLVPGSVPQRHEDILLVLIPAMLIPVLGSSPPAPRLRLRL
jgi:hypothetical protein